MEVFLLFAHILCVSLSYLIQRSFLVRPYLRSMEQFKLFVALYVQLSDDGRNEKIPESIAHLVKDVTFKSVKMEGMKKRAD